MRVFILCTGRSGSTTITRACQHITNYSSSHESLARKFGKERFEYPDNHIEADNRLTWQLGHLNQYYGDDAFYVHLKRNKEKTAHSFLKRYYFPGSIIDSFCEGIRMTPPEKLSKDERLQACYDYIDTVTSNIDHFLINKSNVAIINLETIETDFTEFWERIKASGDLNKALHEFKVHYNQTYKRKFNYRHRLKLLVIREWRHIKMCLKL